MFEAPLHRFHEFTSLSSDEIDALKDAKTERLELERKQVIRSQGDKVAHVYFVVSGWVAEIVETTNGRRQIAKIHLPGDIVGTASLSLERAAGSLIALNRARVDVIPVEAFARLMAQSPRFAFAMFLSTQKERVMLMDHLTSIGRTSAPQRIAAFLLHLHERLKLIDERIGKSFEFPLSQEELAQAVGLTSVHINRTLQELERRRLIERSDRRVTLTDVRALRELASLPTRKFVRDPAWLPAAA
jgi:CRP/FNR family transcriptional regulator, anaerobic regulatory protein